MMTGQSEPSGIRVHKGDDQSVTNFREDLPSFGGVGQDAFLARIRRNLKPTPQHLGYPGSDVSTQRVEERMSLRQKGDRFCAEWEAAGGSVKRASTLEEVYALVKALCIRDGVKKLLYGGRHTDQLASTLKKSGIGADSWKGLQFRFGEDGRHIDYVNSWDAGVMWVDYAVAETGSVAVISRPDEGRSISLLPPRFYALISPETLVAARKTVFEQVSGAIKRGESPSSFTFITGPSRSADIEMDLSVGVHGPGEVTAILLEA